MTTTLSPASPRQLPVLLRGEPTSVRGWVEHWSNARLALCLGVIVVGAGIYGAAIGLWRSGEQALFTAIKFPLILLLTTAGNALLNGVLAPLLGLNLTLRQAASAILLSFTLAATILAAFAPLVFFLVWNVPPLTSPEVRDAYAVIQLSQVGLIAFAGIAANVRLLQLLRELAGSRAVATRILVAWLAGNLLLGTQLTWIARPFFGSPNLPVQFFRQDALKGNFFESVLYNARRLFTE
jgi:hypothetical protein